MLLNVQQARTPMCARKVCSRRCMAVFSNNLLLGPGRFSYRSCIDWSSYSGGCLACYDIIFFFAIISFCQPTRNAGKKPNLRVNSYRFLFRVQDTCGSRHRVAMGLGSHGVTHRGVAYLFSFYVICTLVLQIYHSFQ